MHELFIKHEYKNYLLSHECTNYLLKQEYKNYLLRHECTNYSRIFTFDTKNSTAYLYPSKPIPEIIPTQYFDK